MPWAIVSHSRRPEVRYYAYFEAPEEPEQIPYDGAVQIPIRPVKNAFYDREDRPVELAQPSGTLPLKYLRENFELEVKSWSESQTP